MLHLLLLRGIPFLGLMLATTTRSSRGSLFASSVSTLMTESVSQTNRFSFPEIPIGTNDTSSNINSKTIHVIVLIHGWMGNAKELSVLQSYLQDAAAAQRRRVVVHSIASNEGRTMDGIAAGGRRCAEEIQALLQHVSQSSSSVGTPETDRKPQAKEENTISLSVIGNSLGGLYARYAIGHLPASTRIRPAVFATLCTPHLGVGTPHLPLGLGASIPHWMQTGFADLLGPTGRDLFRISSDIWQELHHPTYQDALRRFRRRVAVANLHQTDLQVPGTTAAFLMHPNETSAKISSAQHTPWTSPINDTHHRSRGSGVAFMVETVQSTTCTADATPPLLETTDRVASSNAMAAQLDALGWVKIFCDMRPHMPDLFSWIGTDSRSASFVADDALSYDDLWRKCAESTHKTMLPLGHTMLVANAKNPFYARLNQAGRPTMEHLAELLMHEMSQEDDEQETSRS